MSLRRIIDARALPPPANDNTPPKEQGGLAHFILFVAAQVTPQTLFSSLARFRESCAPGWTARRLPRTSRRGHRRIGYMLF